MDETNGNGNSRYLIQLPWDSNIYVGIVSPDNSIKKNNDGYEDKLVFQWMSRYPLTESWRVELTKEEKDKIIKIFGNYKVIKH